MWTLLFLLIDVGGDYFAGRVGLEHDLLYLNDLIAAAFIGLLIFLYEMRRKRRMQDRLQIIEQMNHHVRNALQLISLSSHANERDEHLRMVAQAVERIDWALREILPGSDVIPGPKAPAHKLRRASGE
jgi:hypothetical protein